MEQDLRILLKIFDALSYYGLLFDRQGIILAANRKFLDTVGLCRSEITGSSIEILEPYLVGIKEQFVELREHGTHHFHARLVDKDGNTFFIEQTLTCVEDKGENFIAGVGHDLHQLTGRQDAALRKAERQLKTANCLKRKFIANINHAVRTPMNAIVGYAEMLAESDLSRQQQRFVNTIRKNGTALISIINDVMEFSKLEAGSVKVLKSAANLQLVVEQATDLFTEQFRAKNLDFKWTMESALPKMYVMDADHCRQILINLVGNGLKFTDSGTVSLAVSGIETEPGWYDLVFKVMDTGIGMSDEKQQTVRDIFERQNERACIHHDGTNMGLTLCARLARMMGGGIHLKSEKGGGSIFTFTMPAQSADKNRTGPEEAASACPSSTEKSMKSSPVLLVVDDMPEMSNLIKIYFTNSPLQVLEAANGEDCLELARSGQPDLILMDLDLAGVDGRDVAFQLREDNLTAHIPIVVMTGLMLEKDSFTPPFDDFLPKPFHLQELQRLVDNYIQTSQNDTGDIGNGKERYLGPPDVERIQAVWNGDLDSLYDRAGQSGSLDYALTLGQNMEEQGRRTETAELTAMGEELKKFALDFDIRGVERILTALRKVTGKSG